MEILNDITNVTSGIMNTAASVAGPALSLASILADPKHESEIMDADRPETKQEGNVQLVAHATQPANENINQVNTASRLQPVSENPLDLSNLSTKYYPIKELEILSTHLRGHLVGKISYPEDFFPSDSAIATAMQFMSLYEFDLEIEAQINPNQFNQGAAIVMYEPPDIIYGLDYETITSVDPVEPYQWEVGRSINGLKVNPHTLLNYSKVSSGTFRIPYNNAATAFSDESTEIGKVMVVVWSRLYGTDGATNKLALQLFARLVEPKFYVLGRNRLPFTSEDIARSHAIISSLFKGNYSERNMEMAQRELARLIEKKRQHEEQEQWQHENDREMKPFSQYFTNTSVVSKAMNQVHDLGFMDDHAAQATPVVGAPVMTYQDYMKVEGVTTVVTWDTTQAKGTRLHYSEVLPVTNPVPLVPRGSHRLIDISPTPLGYVAMNYRQWRGDIKYKVQAFSTRFHKGRLLIQYTPLVTEAPPTMASDRSTYTWQLDLSTETSEIEFTIPFVSNTRRKLMYSPKVAFGVYDAQDHYKAGNKKRDYMTGILSIWIQNPLVASATVHNAVEIFIYQSAGDNFEVFWPTPDTTQYYQGPKIKPRDTAIDNRYVNENGPETTMPSEGVIHDEASKTAPLIDGNEQPNAAPNTAKFLSASHCSLQALITRPRYCRPSADKIEGHATYWSLRPSEAYETKIPAAYFSGSVYFIAMTNLDKPLLVTAINPRNVDALLLENTKTELGDNTFTWNTANQKTAVFRVPYMQHKAAIRSKADTGDAITVNEFPMVRIQPVAFENTKGTLADDITVLMFFGEDSHFYWPLPPRKYRVVNYKSDYRVYPPNGVGPSAAGNMNFVKKTSKHRKNQKEPKKDQPKLCLSLPKSNFCPEKEEPKTPEILPEEDTIWTTALDDELEDLSLDSPSTDPSGCKSS